MIGPDGLKRILDVLAGNGLQHVPTVCIGGINASNIPRVMFRGSSFMNPLKGIAVVSAIMAAEDPEAASRQLLGLVRDAERRNRRGLPGVGASPAGTKEDLLQLVPQAIRAVHEKKPLTHNMTNLV